MIPDQILDSVSASRRTVVVLSRSYLNSTWSRMEFQAAHTKTMEEKTQVSEWPVARCRTGKPFHYAAEKGELVLGAMLQRDGWPLGRETFLSVWVDYFSSTGWRVTHSPQRVILLLHGSLPPLSQMDEDLQK